MKSLDAKCKTRSYLVAVEQILVPKDEIKETGNYRINVTMQCIETTTTKRLRGEKPNFNYSLNVQVG